MRVGDLDVDIEGAVRAALKRRPRKVALQVPEGLKRRAREMAAAFEAQGFAVTLVGDPCYGACDIFEARAGETVVHVGHTPVGLPGDRKAIFVEAKSTASVKGAVEKALPLLGSNVGLVATSQHAHQLAEAAAVLRKAGKSAVVGRGGPRVRHPGQVLGCDASAARAVADEVDSFLFVGTGAFHPIAVALATGKPTVAADPVTGEALDVAPLAERILRKRHGLIAAAAGARSFGVVIGSKPGQNRKRLAESLARRLRKSGRDASIIVADELEPWRFKAFGFDALVSTACPRLAMDDSARFDVPILTPVEAEIAAGLRGWGDYAFDEISR